MQAKYEFYSDINRLGLYRLDYMTLLLINDFMLLFLDSTNNLIGENDDWSLLNALFKLR
jgi:hypothetical protein